MRRWSHDAQEKEEGILRGAPSSLALKAHDGSLIRPICLHQSV